MRGAAPNDRDHKRATLRGGPLDGEAIVVPGLTAALIVFHGHDFHRYSLAAGSGRVGVTAPLHYDTLVSPAIAGYPPPEEREIRARFQR